MRPVAPAGMCLHQISCPPKGGGLQCERKREKFHYGRPRLRSGQALMKSELKLPCLELPIDGKRNEETLLQVADFVHQDAQQVWIPERSLVRVVSRVQPDRLERCPDSCHTRPGAPKSNAGLVRPQESSRLESLPRGTLEFRKQRGEPAIMFHVLIATDRLGA